MAYKRPTVGELREANREARTLRMLLSWAEDDISSARYAATTQVQAALLENAKLRRQLSDAEKLRTEMARHGAFDHVQGCTRGLTINQRSFEYTRPLGNPPRRYRFWKRRG